MILIFILYSTSLLAQETTNEEGRGAYKTRTLYNLEKFWDQEKVCENPHKGWELHYFDNALDKYGTRLATDDYLEDFPALRSVYLRLAWSFIEPEEGKFNWIVIDSVINAWTARGYDISFRITSKETNTLKYATPEWVKDAGAKGKMVQRDENTQWAPDYGDPVFLEKLDNFHRVFATRYDGKPWLAYVDIGSIGEWGEGHTAYSGWYDIPVEVIKKHIDIFKKHYQKATLIISDDYIGQRDADDGSDDEILTYCLENNIGFRDDSFGVRWYMNLGFGYSNIRNPEIFDLVYEKIPVVLESDHYKRARSEDIWDGGKRFERAIRETHATYIAFHHWPREWLAENQQLAVELANLAGYWYFPKYAVLPDTLRKSRERNYLKMSWENHGVAPAYHRYDLKLKLSDPFSGKVYYWNLKESYNLHWMPDRIVGEFYHLDLPEALIPAKYDIKIGLFDNSTTEERVVELALKNERRDEQGYYKMGEIVVIE